MTFWKRTLIAFGMAATFMTGQALAQESAAPQQADVQGRVMIVLDASGSMLASIKGEQKIDVARKALDELLSDWNPNVNVGLVAYGHRRKGDCADIEVLVPVGAPDKSAIMAAAEKITPLGKTPLSAATILAAETLKYSEEKATVILISDGEETCEKDPCLVGKELEERGVEFTAHVIGFDVSNPDHIAQLRCLAENTGGDYYKAQDAGELQEALSTVARSVAEATPAPEPAVEGLQLSATYSEGGEPVTDKVRWQIFPPKQDGVEDNDKALLTSYDAVAKPELEKEGKYRVEVVVDGTVKKEVEWDTEAGPRHLVVNLDAGMVKAEALPAEGADPITDALTWETYPASDPEKNFATSYHAEYSKLLPAGNYELRVRWGNAKGSTKVTVEAGESAAAQVILASGILEAKALYAEGSEPLKKGLSWEIREGKANIKGEHKRLHTSYNDEPRFSLNEGMYILALRHQGAETEGVVEVKADERVTTTVILNAGVLQYKRASGAAGSFNIYESKTDLSGKRKRLHTFYNKEGSFTMHPGNYVIESVSGEEKEEKEFEIKAGEPTSVEF